MSPPKLPHDSFPYDGNDPASLTNVARYLWDHYVIAWEDAEELAKENEEQIAAADEAGLSARACAEQIATQADLIACGELEEEADGGEDWSDEDEEEEDD